VATKRQKIEVGVFLVSATALFVLVLLVLAGVRGKRLDRYYIEFEENVSGLSEGSKVTYRGVPVGRILHLRVTPQNRVGITVGIDPDKVTLRQGVRAKISMQTLFGPFIIDLFGGTKKDTPPLYPGATIPVKTSLMAGLAETVGEEVPTTLSEAKSLIKNLDRVLSGLAPERIESILKQVEEVLTDTRDGIDDLGKDVRKVASSLDQAIRSARAEIGKTSGKVTTSLEKVQQAMEKGTKLFDTLEATIAENRKPLGDSLKRIGILLARANQQLDALDLSATGKTLRESVGKLGAAADGVTKAAGSVGAAAKSIARTREDLRGSLANVERALVRSLEQLDRTLHSARELFDALERDPSAILRGKRDGE